MAKKKGSKKPTPKKPGRKKTGPKEVSRPTVKRLFAVSGNLCAFPKCSSPLIDVQSGAVIGEVCHIRGEKRGSARYDQRQMDEQRQHFDNLILLCNVHHKVVDDDEVAYTPERLARMKLDHEGRHTSPPSVPEGVEERFVSVVLSNCTVRGSVVTTHGQSGGQTAHSIQNFYGLPPDDEVVVEGIIETAGGLEYFHLFGCVGVRLTVVSRGTRAAKINLASLQVRGENLLKGFQQGFETDFELNQVEGTKQTMVVELLPLTRPNAQEGYVLNRDDVARFFYPLPIPSTMLALQSKPEDVSLAVEFFDGREQVLLTGRPVQDVLGGMVNMYRERAGRMVRPITIQVKVTSTTAPGPETAAKIGTVNQKAAPIVPRPPTQPPSA